MVDINSGDYVLVTRGADGKQVAFPCLPPESGDFGTAVPTADGKYVFCKGEPPIQDDFAWTTTAADNKPVAMKAFQPVYCSEVDFEPKVIGMDVGITLQKTATKKGYAITCTVLGYEKTFSASVSASGFIPRISLPTEAPNFSGPITASFDNSREYISGQGPDCDFSGSAVLNVKGSCAADKWVAGFNTPSASNYSIWSCMFSGGMNLHGQYTPDNSSFGSEGSPEIYNSCSDPVPDLSYCDTELYGYSCSGNLSSWHESPNSFGGNPPWLNMTKSLSSRFPRSWGVTFNSSWKHHECYYDCDESEYSESSSVLFTFTPVY